MGGEQLPANQFLKVHIEDRAEKCIIDHADVVDALVEQSMELIRRDNNDDAALFSGSSDESSQEGEENVTNSLYECTEMSQKVSSFTTAPSEVTLGGRSSIYTPSEQAMSTTTAATTDTKETRIVQNNRYRKYHNRR